MANPYMVLTCFDELLATKGVVFVRGDLISHLDEDEGRTVMNTVLDRYLLESKYEQVNMFNNEPDRFDYQSFIEAELEHYVHLKKHLIDTKPAKLEIGAAKPHGHMTDSELNIFKGGFIR